VSPLVRGRPLPEGSRRAARHNNCYPHGSTRKLTCDGSVRVR
jgi:hypothetical protein